MSNGTHGELTDSSERSPKKKRQVTRGLPSWLQDGQFVMIFGAERPQNDINCTRDATTDIKGDPTSHGDPADDATDNTVPGSSAYNVA